jgi:hypothetical protein
LIFVEALLVDLGQAANISDINSAQASCQELPAAREIHLVLEKVTLTICSKAQSASPRKAELILEVFFESTCSEFGQFQNRQANCSLVLFERFAKIIYKNSNSWGFHSLT